MNGGRGRVTTPRELREGASDKRQTSLNRREWATSRKQRRRRGVPMDLDRVGVDVVAF